MDSSWFTDDPITADYARFVVYKEQQMKRATALEKLKEYVQACPQLLLIPAVNELLSTGNNNNNNNNNNLHPLAHTNASNARADVDIVAPTSITPFVSAPLRKLTAEDVIPGLQKIIEECLEKNMTKQHTIETAAERVKHLGVDKGFVELVWLKLEEQNPDFFKNYYLKLMISEMPLSQPQSQTLSHKRSRAKHQHRPSHSQQKQQQTGHTPRCSPSLPLDLPSPSHSWISSNGAEGPPSDSEVEEVEKGVEELWSFYMPPEVGQTPPYDLPDASSPFTSDLLFGDC